MSEHTNNDITTLDENGVTLTAEVLEETIKSVINIDTEMGRVVSMTPKYGYQKKIELISEAKDMTTKEKLAAIDAAENKYAKDLSNNAEVFKSMMWHKVGLVLVCTAGVVLMGTSPEGRKIAKSILKLAA